MKKNYVSPQIAELTIYLESGLAAGSAQVQPQNSNGQVFEQWTQDDDDNRTLDWSDYK
ncbi:hypothetical protein ACR78I_12970 [Sphingobacterium multivorum]|uniref:hypothetical protein n=1 Tax=Sphingobacterium multivorum TaxID=28454 RepID=UPI003DA3FD73